MEELKERVRKNKEKSKEIELKPKGIKALFSNLKRVTGE